MIKESKVGKTISGDLKIFRAEAQPLNPLNAYGFFG
jgi:hypothetical protein